jgi:hypothetical protein
VSAASAPLRGIHSAGARKTPLTVRKLQNQRIAPHYAVHESDPNTVHESDPRSRIMRKCIAITVLSGSLARLLAAGAARIASGGMRALPGAISRYTQENGGNRKKEGTERKRGQRE